MIGHFAFVLTRQDLRLSKENHKRTGIAEGKQFDCYGDGNLTSESSFLLVGWGHNWRAYLWHHCSRAGIGMHK